MPDIHETESAALATVDRLNAVAVIHDAADYAACGELWKAGRAMMDAISEAYDSIIAAAHKAHKEAVAKKKSFYDPVEEATRKVKGLMAAYDTERERERQAEQRRLEEEARARESERKLAEAIRAEADGNQAQAYAILAEPVVVAPAFVPKAVPKIEGGPVYREIWKVRVVDAALIPREYLIVDEQKLGQMARALKGQLNVPGAEAYSERV
jgi:hypothetical protein